MIFFINFRVLKGKCNNIFFKQMRPLGKVSFSFFFTLNPKEKKLKALPST